MKSRILLFCWIVILLCFAISTPAETLPVVGRAEYAAIVPEGLILKAKIDTGADNSSINAPDQKPFLP